MFPLILNAALPVGATFNTITSSRFSPGTLFKVARTTFLARGIDFQRPSRVRNTHDKGARFKTQKTKRNMAARGFFCARYLLYRWPRNALIKEASLHRKTCINSLYLRKIVSGIHCFQCFPNFKERTKDSQGRCKYGEWTYQQKLFGLFFFATFCNLYFVCSTNTAYAGDRDDEKPNCVSRRHKGCFASKRRIQSVKNLAELKSTKITPKRKYT